MSLLMDALRKAEREKKEAAERLREKQQSLSEETVTAADSGRLSLSLVDDDSNELPGQEQAVDEDTSRPGEQYTVADDPDATLAEPIDGLSLSKLTEQLPENGPEVGAEYASEEVSSVDEKNNAETGSSDVTGLSLEANEEITASGHGENLTIDMSDEAGDETLNSGNSQAIDDTLVLENRGYQVPEKDAATLNETLDMNRTSGSASSREDTREFVTTGSPSYTPVSAQNVFVARKSASYPAITIGILVVLVAIGLVAYGVFYYFSVTHINRDLPSPAVAQGIEFTEALPIVPEATEINTGSGVDDIEPVEPPEIVPTEQQVTARTTKGQPESAVERATSTPPVEDSSGEKAILPEAQDPVPVRPSANAEKTAGKPAASVSEEIELKPQLLQISRSKEPAYADQALVDAYRAYRSGELETAQSLYRAVYSEEPDNINALLGLAAIAVREERHGQAFDYYSAVLRLNPANPNARAAIINLQQQANTSISGSRIRQLLEQYPGSAYLHYALGNVYARQRRWPDAQQEYFSAYSSDSENPDYALNLAVSLDHMNKHGAALQYYKEALKLAGEGTAGFDVVAIEQRIMELAR